MNLGRIQPSKPWPRTQREEPPAKTRVQQRRDEDYRYYAADADLSRAIRQIREAQKIEEGGSYQVGRSMRVDATHLIERHLDFLQIDPEAKL